MSVCRMPSSGRSCCFLNKMISGCEAVESEAGSVDWVFKVKSRVFGRRYRGNKPLLQNPCFSRDQNSLRYLLSSQVIGQADTKVSVVYTCTLKLLNKQVELLQTGKAVRTSLFPGCFDHNL